MNRPTFRAAQREDFEAIVALFTSAEELFRVFPGGRWPFDIKQLHRIAEQRLDLTVCTLDGRIGGFANLYNLQAGHSAFVGNLIVARALRGRGLGRELLHYMLARIFQQHDLPMAQISVFGDNLAALKLYESTGFACYARELRKDSAGRRVELLHLQLDRNTYCTTPH